MSVSDFINDPFGTVAKAGLDAAPDDVRETMHDVAQQVNNPTMPDGGALIENLGADPGGAGTLGEVTAPESYSLGENTFGGFDTADQIIHPDPYAPPEPPHYEVEVGPAQIIDPEDGSVGHQAQGVGADGPWGTSDYGGSAANDASGAGAEGVYDDGTEGPNWTADPNAGTEGPATPDYGPGATGQVPGAEGEVTGVDDYGIF
jgi:hypothetical protein